MNIDEKIRSQADHLHKSEMERKDAIRRRDEMLDAYRRTGTGSYSPCIQPVTAGMNAVIRPLRFRFIYDQPKIRVTLPDGITRVRGAKSGEIPNAWSFDIRLVQDVPSSSNYGDPSGYLWFFEDGTFASAKYYPNYRGNESSWMMQSRDMDGLEDAIINELAVRMFNDEKKKNSGDGSAVKKTEKKRGWFWRI